MLCQNQLSVQRAERIVATVTIYDFANSPHEIPVLAGPQIGDVVDLMSY